MNESKLVKRQGRNLVRTYTKKGTTFRIMAKIRHDDSCGNGHNTFSITGDIDRKAGNGRWMVEAGGCIHEDIAIHFPELAPFIKWHLVSTDGPMGYLANTLYHAGDADHWGRKKGQPFRWETSIRFGNNSILHSFKKSVGFVKFLEEHGPRSNFDFQVIEVHHETEHKVLEYKVFGPKCTFGGFADRWYQCPFDTRDEAERFLDALKNCDPEFVSEPTSFGEGKEPDLEAARNSAVWPDATLEQLTSKQALLDRLPALLGEFREAVTSLGLVY